MSKKQLLLFIAAGIMLALAALWFWQSRGQQAELSITKLPSDNSTLADYYQATADLQPTEQTTIVSFGAVGDIMLSREVANRIQKSGPDAFWPFRKLETELLSTDFNFGNLESPFSGNDEFRNDDQFIFNAPTWTMPGLVQHNFKVLSVANNHILNQGKAGLDFTLNFLADNGTIAVGAGKTTAEAWQGQVYSVKGVRIGFVAATYAVAGSDGANQIAYMREIEKLNQAIADLQTKSDFIVVSMHAGTEYVREPNQQQIQFARTAVEAGADLVLGSHPHWIQTFEQYQGKYIFYSLGNFVFDQMWSQDTREGLMLKIRLEKAGSCAMDPRLSPSGQQQVMCSDSIQGQRLPAKLKTIELVPVIIENYGQPRLATELEAQTILKKIGATTNVITP